MIEFAQTLEESDPAPEQFMTELEKSELGKEHFADLIRFFKAVEAAQSTATPVTATDNDEDLSLVEIV